MLATDVRPPLLEIENARLYACVRDLAALSAMQLSWLGQDAPAVADQFLHSLARSLRLDLAYVRLDESPEGVTIEALSGPEPDVRREVDTVSRAFAPLLRTNGSDAVPTVPHPLHDGELRVKVMSLGTGQQGVLVAASRRGDFPTGCEAAFLDAAVNHLNIWRRASRFLRDRAGVQADDGKTNGTTLEQAQRRHILDALDATSWVMGGPAGAARRLGIPRTTLIYKMQKLGISRANR